MRQVLAQKANLEFSPFTVPHINSLSLSQEVVNYISKCHKFLVIDSWIFSNLTHVFLKSCQSSPNLAQLYHIDNNLMIFL